MMIAMKRAEALISRHLQSQLAGNLLYREVAQLFNFIFFHLSNIILPVSTLFSKILPVSISTVKFLPVSTLFSKILPVSISIVKFYQFPLYSLKFYQFQFQSLNFYQFPLCSLKFYQFQFQSLNFTSFNFNR